MADYSVECADAIEWLAAQPADSCDLVFGSPPYESARLYLEGGKNLGVARKTEEWVAWMVEVYRAAQRVCCGLVAFVVAGQTKNRRWSAGPALLAADLHRAGFNLRNPPIFWRVGIPGGGGKKADHEANGGSADWLRSDYELIICTSRPGKLPWADTLATGHPPKWAPGGEMSHRVSNGARVNQWGTSFDKGGPISSPDGQVKKNSLKPSHKLQGRRVTSGHKNGDTPNGDSYDPPTLANPGNVLRFNVGGGVMGNELCHQNEAPFPFALAEFFVRSFCPPGGVVIDPFSGSGTTADAALTHGRNFRGCDLRQSQVDLTLRRISETTPLMFPE